MLRREILRFERDGVVELYDPVMDRVHALTPGEDPPAILEEGPVAEAIRRAWWSRKRATMPPPPSPAPPADADWGAAETLPAEVIGPSWRVGETWRRLAEDRAAGAVALPMPALLAPAFARALADAHAGLAYERMQTELTTADRHVCAPDDGRPVADWLAAMASPAFRALAGAVVGLPLPASVTANAWRLRPGDQIRAHVDGSAYVATISLGLTTGWTAGDGGAVAFADVAPGEPAFVVRSRWLPHLGDAVVIARGPAAWHWVEPPRRVRRTFTSWWALP